MLTLTLLLSWALTNASNNLSNLVGQSSMHPGVPLIPRCYEGSCSGCGTGSINSGWLYGKSMVICDVAVVIARFWWLYAVWGTRVMLESAVGKRALWSFASYYVLRSRLLAFLCFSDLAIVALNWLLLKDLFTRLSLLNLVILLLLEISR